MKSLYNEVIILFLCSPRDPRFVDSNPAEVDEFFSGSLKNLKPEKIDL